MTPATAWTRPPNPYLDMEQLCADYWDWVLATYGAVVYVQLRYVAPLAAKGA